MIIEIASIILISYLLGSIPSGIIFSKIFSLGDLRKIGSGNIGTTNVLRTGNYTAAALTLTFDFGKAYAAIYASSIINSDLILLSGLTILIGHIFPIWINFKGGKGFASYLGIICSLDVFVFLIMILLWLIIFYLKKISSLAALLSALIGLIISISFINNNIKFTLFFLTLVIFLTHIENIKRLYNGTEDKIK
tara:strand:- start:352 stop:930 length:579 start_codon:yes stop_codon:yes gene_type:complete